MSAPQRIDQTSFSIFFFDGGGDGGVADVGVDLHQEVAADDDGLEFRVVDVGGDDGAAAGDFAADEFGGDEGGDLGAEVFAVIAAVFRAFGHRFAADVFAVGDVGHLGGDDAGLGVLVLREALAGLGAQGRGEVGELRDQLVAGDVAIVFGLHMAAGVGRRCRRARRSRAGGCGAGLRARRWRRWDRCRGRWCRRRGSAAPSRWGAARSRDRGRSHPGSRARGSRASARRASGPVVTRKGCRLARVDGLVHGVVSCSVWESGAVGVKVSSMIALASSGRSMCSRAKTWSSFGSSLRRT